MAAINGDEMIDYVARKTAADTFDGLSALSSDVRRVEGKVDGLISDMRDIKRGLGSMRPKVDSSAAFVTDEQRVRKLRRRLVLAVLLGAAGTFGAGLGTAAWYETKKVAERAVNEQTGKSEVHHVP